MNRALGRRIRDLTGPLFDPLYFVYLFINERKAFRFFPGWLRSFGQSSIRDGVPWLPFELIEWLDKQLSPQMHVFEFGSGGSTIYFASKVKVLVSVEHDRSWYEEVTHALKSRQIFNVEYLLREPELTHSSSLIQYSDNYGTRYANMSFAQYVKSIDCYPDKFFDIVLVDGRSRKGCIEHAVPKIRQNGFLVFDNSSTQEYLEFLTPLNKHPRFDFTSISPFWPPGKWQSSVWQII
jgi:hypothetical protein